VSSSEALGPSEGPAVEAPAKLSGPSLVQWFTDRLGHSVSDLSRTRADQASDAGIEPADKERWVPPAADVSHITTAVCHHACA